VLHQDIMPETSARILTMPGVSPMSIIRRHPRHIAARPRHWPGMSAPALLAQGHVGMIGALFLMAAAPVPAMIGTDPHVSIRDYAENQVITFAARPNYQSTIQFGDDERIENIAVGESGAWQITPNRRANLLFVKPTSAKAPVTNMTVVTDRHTYLFELRSSAGASRFTSCALPMRPIPPPRPFPRRRRQA
jgi:type IV secretion system protein VirB9